GERKQVIPSWRHRDSRDVPLALTEEPVHPIDDLALAAACGIDLHEPGREDYRIRGVGHLAWRNHARNVASTDRVHHSDHSGATNARLRRSLPAGAHRRQWLRPSPRLGRLGPYRERLKCLRKTRSAAGRRSPSMASVTPSFASPPWLVL